MVINALTILAFIGFGGIELELYKDKTYFYLILGIFSVFAISFINLFESNLKYVKAVIHNPVKEGWSFITNTKWAKNFWLFTTTFLFLATLITAISSAFKVFFTGLPEFQIYKLTHLWYAVEPASSGETLTHILGYWLGKGYIDERFKKDDFTRTALNIAWLIVMSILFVLWHLVRYGNEQGILVSVFIFALLSLLLTWAFGSIIPAYIFHASSNLFQKLELTTTQTEFMVFVFILLTLELVVIFALLQRGIKRVTYEY